MDMVQKAYLMWLYTFFFIDDLTYWFFNFNCLQIKLLRALYTILFIIGFYNIYMSKHKTFINKTSVIVVNLHLWLLHISHSARNSWSLIILTATQKACQLPKSNFTKSFFLSHFPKKLCA